MARAFRCKSCGTGYSTVGDDIPPSAPWADGHVCEMTEVEYKFKQTKLSTGIPISKEELAELRSKARKSNLQPCQAHAEFSDEEEERMEARMKIIGQNGNTGEHYEE